MPLSVYKKLGLRDTEPITVSLQLADRSIKCPKVLIKMCLAMLTNLFSHRFYNTNIEEDQDIPIILGPLFLYCKNVNLYCDFKMSKSHLMISRL